MHWICILLALATVAYVWYVGKYQALDCVKLAQYQDVDTELGGHYPTQILYVEFYNGKKEFYIRRLYHEKFQHYPTLEVVEDQKLVWDYHYKAIEYGNVRN